MVPNESVVKGSNKSQALWVEVFSSCRRQIIVVKTMRHKRIMYAPSPSPIFIGGINLPFPGTNQCLKYDIVFFCTCSMIVASPSNSGIVWRIWSMVGRSCWEHPQSWGNFMKPVDGQDSRRFCEIISLIHQPPNQHP